MVRAGSGRPAPGTRGDGSTRSASSWRTGRRRRRATEATPTPTSKRSRAILARHEAALVCQYDAFAFYCAEAERLGIALTTRSMPGPGQPSRHPAKKAKYLRSFSLRVAGEEVYGLERADALEAALQPLAGGPAVRRIARHDTDPANNPQPPERYRP